jgi:fatty acid desaturase
VAATQHRASHLPHHNHEQDQYNEKITNLTPTQRCAFELIGVLIPLTLANT